MPEFVSDTFVDPDNTRLETHSPDLGDIWEQLSIEPGTVNFSVRDAFIVSNQLTGSRDGRNLPQQSSLYRNAADPGTNEYDVRATMVLGSTPSVSTPGLYTLGGRMSSTGTNNASVDRYTAHYRYISTIKKFTLRKVISGVETQLDFLDEDIGLGSFSLKLEIRDAAKKVFLGVVEKLSSADDTITQDGRVGVAVPKLSTINYIDNFVAETPTAGPPVITGIAQFTGVGVLVGTAQSILFSTTSLVGAGALLATGVPAVLGAAPFVGAGVLQPTGISLTLASVILVGAGQLDADGLNILLGSVPLVGSGALLGIGHAIVFSDVELTGVGVLLGTGEVISSGIIEGFAQLAGAGVLNATGVLVITGAVPLSGSGALDADGLNIIVGGIPLSGFGVLLGTGLDIAHALVALDGAGVLLATGHTLVLGGAPLAGVGVLLSQGEVVGDFQDFGEIIRRIVASVSDVYRFQVVAKSVDGVKATEVRLWNIDDGQVVDGSLLSTISQVPAILTSEALALTGSKEYKAQMKGTGT